MAQLVEHKQAHVEYGDPLQAGAQRQVHGRYRRAHDRLPCSSGRSSLDLLGAQTAVREPMCFCGVETAR